MVWFPPAGTTLIASKPQAISCDPPKCIHRMRIIFASAQGCDGWVGSENECVDLHVSDSRTPGRHSTERVAVGGLLVRGGTPTIPPAVPVGRRASQPTVLVVAIVASITVWIILVIAVLGLFPVALVVRSGRIFVRLRNGSCWW